MLFPNSCRCGVGGETIRPSSQSSRVRCPYSTPLFFFPFFFFSFFFFSMGGGVLCMYVPFFFATHHPPVITTCSWGSVGPLPCTSQSLRWPSSFTHVCTRKKRNNCCTAQQYCVYSKKKEQLQQYCCNSPRVLSTRWVHTLGHLESINLAASVATRSV